MAAWIDATARPRSHTKPRSAFQVNSMQGAMKEEQTEQHEEIYEELETIKTMMESKEMGMLFGPEANRGDGGFERARHTTVPWRNRTHRILSDQC
jgi:predicted Zn-ribbon and HTH transcriptional regulator